MVFHGFSYGVLDHNVFQDTLDKVISVGGDGAPAEARTPVVGGYENGTIFIEDNEFTLTGACSAHFGGDPRGAAENVFDGNSGPRIVFRSNKVTDAATCRWQYPLEVHGFESEFSTVGDARPVFLRGLQQHLRLQLLGRRHGAQAPGTGGGGVVFNNTFIGPGRSFARWRKSGTPFSHERRHWLAEQGQPQCGRIYAARAHEAAGRRRVDLRALFGSQWPRVRRGPQPVSGTI